MNEYQEAIERSKIPRLNWKKILGTSMNEYVKNKVQIGYTQEDIVHQILLSCKHLSSKKHLEGWKFDKIVENVKTGVSARFAELKIYGIIK